MEDGGFMDFTPVKSNSLADVMKLKLCYTDVILFGVLCFLITLLQQISCLPELADGA